MKIILLLLLMMLLRLTPGHTQSEEEINIEEKPFTYIEKMPAFPGGIDEMYKFIYGNLKYPSEAKKWNVSGSVITQFVVDADGSLRDIRVVRGHGYGLDEEAMRVIELMNAEHRWDPGTHNGKPVPVTFTLPIKFVL